MIFQVEINIRYTSPFRIKGIRGIQSIVTVDCPTSALCIVSTVDQLTQPPKGEILLRTLSFVTGKHAFPNIRVVSTQWNS